MVQTKQQMVPVEKGMMKELSTVIIEKPKKPTVNGKKQKYLLIKCNDSKVYTVTQLASLIGINSATLLIRISKYGWNSELILMSKKEMEKVKLVNQTAGLHKSLNTNKKLDKLSDKIRRDNLKNIPGPGKFEMQGL